MKFGFRSPSLKKSFKARTTGKIKRSVTSSINPLYAKKGMGYINDPKKAIYNKVYNKTTFGVSDLMEFNSLSANSIIDKAPYNNLTLKEIKEKNKENKNKKIKNEIIALKMWKYSTPILILLTLLLCIIFPFLLIIVLALLFLEQKSINKIKVLESTLKNNE